MDEKRITICGDDDSRGGAESAVDDFLHQAGATLDSYLGVDEGIKSEVSGITKRLFSLFGTRSPTAYDFGNVFCAVRGETIYDGNEYTAQIDQEKVKLLSYAFQQSANAGVACQWNYIYGCLAKMSQRGISRVTEAEDYDGERR